MQICEQITYLIYNKTVLVNGLTDKADYIFYFIQG